MAACLVLCLQDGDVIQDTLERQTVRRGACSNGRLQVSALCQKLCLLEKCNDCSMAQLQRAKMWFQHLPTQAPHSSSAPLPMQGRRTVPQIFIGGAFIGGAEELDQLASSGQLAQRLG